MDAFWDKLIVIWENEYFKAVFLIIVSFLSAFLINAVIKFFLKKIVLKTKNKIDDKLLEILSFPLFITIFFIGVSFAIGFISLQEKTSFVIYAIIKTIIILSWSIGIFNAITIFIDFFENKRGKKRFIQKRTAPLFDNVLKLLLVIGSLYFIFLTWKINITAWIASAGIIGIAVGFAAKDTLANLFAGISIIVDAPYKIGDYITLDTGERGEVNLIGLRSTRIITPDYVEITIPNSVIANTKVSNENGGKTKKNRLKIQVGVEYGSDIDKVKKVMRNIAVKNGNVCDEPEPIVRLTEFADSSLNMQLLCWLSNSSKRGQVIDELNTAIYKEFAKNKIGIPFPQMDVNLKRQD